MSGIFTYPSTNVSVVDSSGAAIGALGDSLNTFSKDFLLEVSKGNVTGHSVEDKFAASQSIGTSMEVIWEEGGSYNWLASALTLNITSTDANDTSAGTGAQTLTIYGLDSDFAIQSETISMNGLTIVNTANTYRRIYRMIVNTEGSSASANTGKIYCFSGTETSGVPDDTTKIYASIISQNGQTLMSPYTVPASKTAYLINEWSTSGAGKNAGIQFFHRPLGKARNIKIDFDILDSSFLKPFTAFLSIAEKTDIWVEGKVNTGTTKISAGYDLLLIDN